jgi:hypothetical protein
MSRGYILFWIALLRALSMGQMERSNTSAVEVSHFRIQFAVMRRIAMELLQRQ